MTGHPVVRKLKVNIFCETQKIPVYLLKICYSNFTSRMHDQSTNRHNLILSLGADLSLPDCR